MFGRTDGLYGFLCAYVAFIAPHTHFWCDTRLPKIHKYSSLGRSPGRGVASVYGVLGEGREQGTDVRTEDGCPATVLVKMSSTAFV